MAADPSRSRQSFGRFAVLLIVVVVSSSLKFQCNNSNSSTYSQNILDSSSNTPPNATPSGRLTDDFYLFSCPLAEAIISQGVAFSLLQDPSLSAALLRMAFHDCFVHGCDASVLLLFDQNGNPAEREAPPNKNSLRGFEVLDGLKASLEIVCPNTVSCADLVVMVAREAVVQAGGPYYSVAKGRRDSVNSSAKAAAEQLPLPDFNIAEMKTSFANKGLNETSDLVSLLGAHTIGLVNCTIVSRRLQNFQNGLPDGRLNMSLFLAIAEACAADQSTDSTMSKRISLDPGSSQVFDNSYYKNLLRGSGLLAVDQALMDDPATGELVRAYAEDQQLFFEDFKGAMMKMSNLNVLTGQQGEIRRNCSLQN